MGRLYLAWGIGLVYIVHWLVPGATALTFDCQPGQSCWPTNAEWEAFNGTLSGRLQATVMMSSPCFPSSPNYNSDTCLLVKENWFNGTFREQFYGSTQNALWESCGTANCYPGIYPPQGETCSLGRLSALHVDVETISDIVATLEFVKTYGIRLTIHNTGHDLLGRSEAANTLALRTHNLKSMTYVPSFTADNCSAANGQDIGIIGAGVTAEEALKFFSSNGQMITMGGCESVGVAGGFGQGGGHGPLGPTYGLMVDQAVEFDVVTADGVYRTINECNDPELFWAMRGGGGASYAVLVNYKFQLYPSAQWATYRLEATITGNYSTVLQDVLTALANNQLEWTKNHVSGWDAVTPLSVKFLEVLPGVHSSDPLGTLKELTSGFNNTLASLPGLNITENVYTLWSDESNFYAGEEDYLDPSSGTGYSLVTPSRLITSDRFESQANIDSLVESLVNALEGIVDLVGLSLTSQVPITFVKSTPFNTPDAHNATSANPVWRDAVWHMIISGLWVPGEPDSVSTLVSEAARNALDTVKQQLTVQASYLNEADPAEEDWQDVFFGKNYWPLLKIKAKYDPENLFRCWRCVGFDNNTSDPMFSCYGDNPVPSIPYPFN